MSIYYFLGIWGAIGILCALIVINALDPKPRTRRRW